MLCKKQRTDRPADRICAAWIFQFRSSEAPRRSSPNTTEALTAKCTIASNEYNVSNNLHPGKSPDRIRLVLGGYGWISAYDTLELAGHDSTHLSHDVGEIEDRRLHKEPFPQPSTIEYRTEWRKWRLQRRRLQSWSINNDSWHLCKTDTKSGNDAWNS